MPTWFAGLADDWQVVLRRVEAVGRRKPFEHLDALRFRHSDADENRLGAILVQLLQCEIVLVQPAARHNFDSNVPRQLDLEVDHVVREPVLRNLG